MINTYYTKLDFNYDILIEGGMAHLPSMKLKQFYEQYKDKQLTFNNETVRATGLEGKKVFLKVHGEDLPCVLFSTSLSSAKIVVNLTTTDFEMIKKSNNSVSLRLGFNTNQMLKPIAFFIQSTIDGYSSYNSKSETSFLVTLKFNQKPSDDFLEIIGMVFDTIDTFSKRGGLRIPFDTKIAKSMGFGANQVVGLIEGIKRTSIITNISASGCQIIMMCNPKFIMQKNIQIFIPVINGGVIKLEGKIIRSDNVEGRKDLSVLGIEFEPNKIPHTFKKIFTAYVIKLEEIAKGQAKK